ncbi:hypothetical protein Spica_2797 [Gracilinema caldarium DSM 7334]|uniref:Uncharacterized protein n=1 Tax=Gracilinema caldarium (strain ATCC 51460 / DSM 7334 / H1) TaxID=744872 RepID=F8F2B0_GRAC1|nr:hypothetical protein Spica_2797 [Gracilinema caldarium DSM 7334]
MTGIGTLIGYIDYVQEETVAVLSTYMITQDENYLVSYEIKNGTEKRELLGRYERKGYRFLAATEEYYLICNDFWYVSLDRCSNGVAREHISEPCIGIKEVVINYKKKDKKALIGFQHGRFVYYYDELFQLVTIE